MDKSGRDIFFSSRESFFPRREFLPRVENIFAEWRIFSLSRDFFSLSREYPACHAVICRQNDQTIWRSADLLVLSFFIHCCYWGKFFPLFSFCHLLLWIFFFALWYFVNYASLLRAVCKFSYSLLSRPFLWTWVFCAYPYLVFIEVDFSFSRFSQPPTQGIFSIW